MKTIEKKWFIPVLKPGDLVMQNQYIRGTRFIV